MATHNKTLHLIASKLGLGEEEKVLRKAAEFERLLQTKSVAGTNMTDTSKIVICLDLAAFLLGMELDTKTAIKYSGLKASIYTNCRKIVENLLELSGDRLSVLSLCVTLQCTAVQELAENMLTEYQKQAKMEIDLNLPQYVCMAVHQACRISKVKVSKSKLLAKSRLKPGQWAKLEAEWSKYVDENFATAKKKRGRPPKTVVNDEEEKMEVEKGPKEELTQEPQVEAYEDWKKRMLEAAYKELKELEQKKQEQIVESIEEVLSPLRQRKSNKQIVESIEEEVLSPTRQRKNSQIMSPRKSTGQLSPSKDSFLSPTNNTLSPSLKISLRFPASKVRQLSSRLNSQDVSPRIGQLAKSQLSPTKISHLSPRKEVSTSPMQEDMSPRRSPRKTPQKYSPYKTPTPKNGVRLLFPKNL